VFSGKFLDYLAARRPIFAAGGTGNDEVVIKILNETQAGVYAVSVSEIKNAILAFYREYKQTGTVSYKGNLHKVNEYSSQSMCKKFAEHLDDLTNLKAT
jgi:hypothetical protein